MKKIKRNILLNPGPATTTDSVKYAQVVPDICPREKEFGELMQSIRKDLVKIAGGADKTYTCILFGGSGTAVMESIITSVVPPNKKILIINNGAYGKRMATIAKTYNMDAVELQFKSGTKIDIEKIQSLFDQHQHISSIAAIHHETTTGMLNPIKEIGEIAKKNDCTFIVDAISSFAGIPFSMTECNIDFMMSTANKCIQGMPGIAFVICKKNELEKIKDYQKRTFYLDLYAQYEYLEKERQMRFTAPVQTMYALRQAIDEFYAEGSEKRYKRYQKSYVTLIKGLKEMGFTLLLKDDVDHSQLLTTVYEPDDPNFNFNVLHDKLYARGFTIYPGKITEGNTFRIANMGAIDYRDIQRFLKILRETLEEMKVKIN